MKYAAIFMAVLVVLALGVGVYALANAHLVVVSVTEEVTPGFERQEDFTALQTAMDQNALLGTPFVEELDGSSMDYDFRTYTFRLRNPGMIGAEMVEVQAVPGSGDALCYATLDARQVNADRQIPAYSEGDLWCVVLTSAQQPSVPRDFRITYYMWGMQKSVTATYR